MPVDEIAYWARRAAEERRLAASLPEGPPAHIHLVLARLYERAISDNRARLDAARLPLSEVERPDRVLKRRVGFD